VTGRTDLSPFELMKDISLHSALDAWGNGKSENCGMLEEPENRVPHDERLKQCMANFEDCPYNSLLLAPSRLEHLRSHSQHNQSTGPSKQTPCNKECQRKAKHCWSKE